MIKTVDDLIKELEQYPKDMDVYYATKYALVPCAVKKLDNRCISIDMLEMEKNKYMDWK